MNSMSPLVLLLAIVTVPVSEGSNKGRVAPIEDMAEENDVPSWVMEHFNTEEESNLDEEIDEGKPEKEKLDDSELQQMFLATMIDIEEKKSSNTTTGKLGSN